MSDQTVPLTRPQRLTILTPPNGGVIVLDNSGGPDYPLAAFSTIDEALAWIGRVYREAAYTL